MSIENDIKERTFCEEDIIKTYRFLGHKGKGVTEIRILSKEDGMLIAYVVDEKNFVRLCQRTSSRFPVYVGIQPRPIHVYKIQPNSFFQTKSTKDDDIRRIQALVIDIDSIREKDTAATEEERAPALACGERIAAWCEEKGYERPAVIDSGNGCQVWFAIPEIQLTEENREDIARRLKSFEKKIRDKFSADGFKIDSISNYSRIIRVAGTLNIKGPNTAERPHRLSRPIGDFERREDAELLHVIMTRPLPPEEQESISAIVKLKDLKIDKELNPMWRVLIMSGGKLKDYFYGKNKTEGDTSSSGYDFSLAMSLAVRGHTDPDALATILYHRPDGQAKKKGARHIARTIEKALAAAAKVNEMEGRPR